MNSIKPVLVILATFFLGALSGWLLSQPDVTKNVVREQVSPKEWHESLLSESDPDKQPPEHLSVPSKAPEIQQPVVSEVKTITEWTRRSEIATADASLHEAVIAFEKHFPGILDFDSRSELKRRLKMGTPYPEELKWALDQQPEALADRFVQEEKQNPAKALRYAHLMAMKLALEIESGQRHGGAEAYKAAMENRSVFLARSAINSSSSLMRGYVLRAESKYQPFSGATLGLASEVIIAANGISTGADIGDLARQQATISGDVNKLFSGTMETIAQLMKSDNANESCD